MIAEALREERRVMAERIRKITVYGTSQPSSDPMNPFGSSEKIITVEDLEMFRAGLADLIEAD